MLVISAILSKWVSVWFIYLSVDAWQIFDHVVICRQYRNLAAKKKFTPWPIEMRFCEDSASQHKPRYLPIFLPRCSPQFAFYFILAWFRQVWPQISTRTLFILKFSIDPSFRHDKIFPVLSAQILLLVEIVMIQYLPLILFQLKLLV